MTAPIRFSRYLEQLVAYHDTSLPLLQQNEAMSIFDEGQNYSLERPEKTSGASPCIAEPVFTLCPRPRTLSRGRVCLTPSTTPLFTRHTIGTIEGNMSNTLYLARQ